MAEGESKHQASEKWTEIEHLPKWDEEFYDVYTAKKYGKWVMLKTLKAEYKDKEEYIKMLNKEFDVRYNLSHPNIVMINDIEDVPGVGMSIITDDVYGDSLRTLIDEKKLTEAHIDKLRHQLVDALEYIQTNHIVHHPIRPERILFTENIGNLKLIDVGFDQREFLEPTDAAEDIYNYGKILEEVINAVPGLCDPVLRKVAARCTAPIGKRFSHIQDIHLALENRKSNTLYKWLIGFLVAMILLMAWLSSPYAPSKPNLDNNTEATK
jgi:serine/threonine protein kinase